MEASPKIADESRSPSRSDSTDEEFNLDSFEEKRLSQLINQVFNEQLLREMIIDHVIHLGKRVSASHMKACRLVQKSWLRTVSKLHRKHRVPLFIFHLNNYNSLQELPCDQENGKLLDQFLNKALNKTSPTFEDDHVPPFSIKASQDFFAEENYVIFRDILFKYGNGLVKMSLEIPKNGGSMPLVFPFLHTLFLPFLTNFTVQFAKKKTDDQTDGNNVNFLQLIQSILNASHHSLKMFYFPFTQWDTIPSGLGYLTLPVSLKTLHLGCQMKSKDLNILLNNNLPNLKDLSLVIPQTPFDDGLISQVLARISETLENIKFAGVTHSRVPGIRTYFNWPAVMKNLKQLWIASAHFELGNGLGPLETNLPKLTSLGLSYQTVSMFRKWVDNSKFETVLDLRMSLVDENFHYKHASYFVNVEAEIMQSILFVFPNLKHLGITVCGPEMSGLQYLFLVGMKQLESIEIRVRRTDNLVDSDFWDSLLIGVRLEFATIMRTMPHFRETFEIKDQSRPSIRNLSKLRALTIKTEDSSLDLTKVPLISDSVFHFGFLKMPNLRKLVFGGRFSVSIEMRNAWKAESGRWIFHEGSRIL